ncbi:MAG: alpha/beta hydrolase-fold protein [Saprospiraceae bacterium]|nr:alpha/beta hydrolase-fold protein [Saprospiraceae bacterium]
MPKYLYTPTSLVSLLLFGLLVCSSCKKRPTLDDEDFQFFTLYSQAVQDEYKLYLSLPPDYDSNKTYPLVVGLDGDNEYQAVGGLIHQLIKNNEIPPVIFVAVGYGSQSMNDKKRNRDYTPTLTTEVEEDSTGGAAQFYTFLSTELYPYLKTNYAVDSTIQQTLLGHSYGGLFTYFALFETQNNPFHNFIAAGSSFWYDSGVIFEYESNYNSSNTDLNKTLYSTMGGLEGLSMLASFAEMNERLKSRNYASFNMQTKLLDNYGHSRSDYISFEQGLIYALNQ